jgi:RNA polymerase sigma-70 factor (ECF subfamily)
VFAAAQNVEESGQFAKEAEALEELCAIYRTPIIKFCKYQLGRTDDAEDIGQAFLAELAQSELLSSADQKKGRFRTLVLTVLKRFVSDLRARENAEKRGGQVKFVPLSETSGEDPSLAADDAGAELFFDIEWAKTVVRESLDQLRIKQTEPRVFTLLEPFLTAKLAGADAENVAQALETSVDAVEVRLHRFRKAFQKILRQEVAKTVGAADQVDGELRHLRNVIVRYKLSV